MVELTSRPAWVLCFWGCRRTALNEWQLCTAKFGSTKAKECFQRFRDWNTVCPEGWVASYKESAEAGKYVPMDAMCQGSVLYLWGGGVGVDQVCLLLRSLVSACHSPPSPPPSPSLAVLVLCVPVMSHVASRQWGSMAPSHSSAPPCNHLSSHFSRTLVPVCVPVLRYMGVEHAVFSLDEE
jgi:hypothetical protein